MELLPRQQAALRMLAAVPGVVGSMVFDAAGAVVAAEFPATFDPAGLRQLASHLAGDGYFQDWVSGGHAALDLRFLDGLVAVRPIDGQWLLVLSTPQVNSQLLSMSLTQAARRLRVTAEPGATQTGEYPIPGLTPPPMALTPAPAGPEGGSSSGNRGRE